MRGAVGTDVAVRGAVGTDVALRETVGTDVALPGAVGTDVAVRGAVGTVELWALLLPCEAVGTDVALREAVGTDACSQHRCSRGVLMRAGCCSCSVVCCPCLLSDVCAHALLVAHTRCLMLMRAACCVPF